MATLKYFDEFKNITFFILFLINYLNNKAKLHRCLNVGDDLYRFYATIHKMAQQKTAQETVNETNTT